MSLILDDIHFEYSAGTDFAVSAIRGASLSVDVGELVLVLGATGSGKSTLLRIAAGLTAPSAGFVEMDGSQLDAESARGAVGLVFQDAESQLFAETVAEDIAFGPANMGVNASEIAHVVADSLRVVGLDPEEFGPRSPFTLSGGEARRVALAGVLAMRPRYLLIDEPTAGLDASGRRLLHRAIMSARDAAGVVVVTHSAEEFLASASTVVLLREGTVSWSGPAIDAIADPGVFARAGLVAPDVLEVQRRVVARTDVCLIPALEADVAVSRMAEAGVL